MVSGTAADVSRQASAWAAGSGALRMAGGDWDSGSAAQAREASMGEVGEADGD